MGKHGLTRRGILLGLVVATVIVVSAYFGFFAQYQHQHESKGTRSVLVTTSDGPLRGEWVDAVQGRGFQYAAFRGIPYAQPPIHDLRFKGPRRCKKWKEVRDATKEGSRCFQHGTGSEDCLYLNVYSPKLPAEQAHPKMAVYVFIHGGKFLEGCACASMYGPDFLVQQDIVVVTLNYRVGVFGFLALDTEDVPGNAGLKDQVQALRWIHENIHLFGGDPSKVTIGGQSAGSVSAGLLTLLPAAKGLFRSAILQSGTSVSFWAYTSRNVEFAKKVAEILSGKISNDVTDIARVVREAAPGDLFDAGENASEILHDRTRLGSEMTLFYAPSIEARQQGEEEILMSRDPESYIIKSETNDIPIILGQTKREWAKYFQINDIGTNYTLLEEAIKDLTGQVPCTIVPGMDTQKLLSITEKVPDLDVNKYVKEIRDYYFKNNDTECDDSCKMAKYLDVAYISADTSHLMRLRAKYSAKATYAYVFSVKSDYNIDTSSFQDYLKDAVVHGDCLRYIWHRDDVKADYYGNGTASRALRRHVTMLSNFVKEGDPTPTTDDLITVRWKPVLQDESETYLDIGENLIQKQASLLGDAWSVWYKTFSELRDRRSP